MPFQFSTSARNAALDAIETAIGLSPVMVLRTGAVPASCAAARTGTVVATIPCPADFLAAAAAGAKTLLGSWQDVAADASGTAGYFSIEQGGVTHIQGTVTATGGGGDVTLDNPILAAGQQVTITAFTITIGGA
jgi:hypothetical protein